MLQIILTINDLQVIFKDFYTIEHFILVEKLPHLNNEMHGVIGKNNTGKQVKSDKSLSKSLVYHQIALICGFPEIIY